MTECQMATNKLYVDDTVSLEAKFYRGGKPVVLTEPCTWTVSPPTAASVVSTGNGTCDCTGDVATDDIQVQAKEAVSGYTLGIPMDIVAAELGIDGGEIVMGT